MLPNWLILVFAIAAGVASVGAAMAVIKKLSGPLASLAQVMRLIVGENLPNGGRVDGLLDNVETLKESMADIQLGLDQVVNETSPNHGSSMKDVVNSIKESIVELKTKVDDNASKREHYQEIITIRDEEQNRRLEKIESEVSDLARTLIENTKELRDMWVNVSGRLDEHTAMCSHPKYQMGGESSV